MPPSSPAPESDANAGRDEPRTALVTGANSGIGLALSTALATRGWRVFLHGRDAEKLGRAKRKVSKAGEARTFKADLADLEQVRRLAERVQEATGRLDALVNNAGLVVSSCRLTPQRIETTMAVNAVAPWALFDALRPLMASTAEAHGEARLVNVTSAAHRGGRFVPPEASGDAEALAAALREPPRGYNAIKAYSQSKLAITAWTLEAARRLEGTGVTANCVHPGVVRTGIFPGLGGAGGFFATLFSVFYLPPSAGARGPLMLAADPAWRGRTGRFVTRGHFRGPHEAEPPEQARDPAWGAAAYDAMRLLAVTE